MPSSSPKRSPTFRLITIAASGLGSFIVGSWGFRYGFGGDVAGISVQLAGGIVAALCAMGAALAALSFFAGVDESVAFVFHETQIDKLTGLFGRSAMIGKIAQAAASTLRSGRPVFLIDIDIDRFKYINDAIGYSKGDELIRAFAARLQALVPSGGEIGRIGAGEFAMLVPDGKDCSAVQRLAESLLRELAEPYELASHLQSVSLSVGVVAMPKDGRDPMVLLRRSNLALQNARSTGIGNWSVFDPAMGHLAEQRQWIEAEIHSAFERGDFSLNYQPEMVLATNEIVGYEALIRWRHPERGMIPPADFIPVAEETGMIGPIGEWVLRQACHDALSLPDRCFVAVNISPVQFMTRDFVSTVVAILQESGLPASRLELEITETAMMQDRERAAAILGQLAEFGVSVAVDDFGTGYSNLSYLIDFPFRKLKIDRSFVSRIDRDNGGAVVSTIVGLSRALGVDTIAEGVETENQATLLRAAGCDVVQGFLFGRPAPLIEGSLVEGGQERAGAAKRQRIAQSALKEASRASSPLLAKLSLKAAS